MRERAVRICDGAPFYFRGVKMSKKIPIENRINREDLKFLIRNFSFSEIGRDFGVDCNTVKRWCDYYDLPRNKSDIKLFDDLEWYFL